MAKTSVPNYAPTHDEIAAQAYQIYLREGCVAGRDLDHWLQAEAELRSGANGIGNGDRRMRDIAKAPNGAADSSKAVAAPAPVTAAASRNSTSRRTVKR